jgi:MATE family multidrug resistance protein
MVPLGIASAASTRVGNLLGAGADWTRAAWTAVTMGGSVMAASSFALLMTSEAIAGAYLPRPEDTSVRALAAGLIPMAALFQVFDGVQVVSFGVLRGAGDTRVPAVANVVGYYAVGLPLGAWLLEAGWGPRGVWVGLCVALAIVASLLVARIVQVARLGGFRRSV